MHSICPKCDRPLSKPNGWHYCQRVSIEDLLRGKSPALSLLMDHLLSGPGSWEGVSVSATKNCVVFLAAKTFLVVRVMKRELDLKFPLPEESDEFPIYKKVAYGKKLERHIRLCEEADWDGDVQRFLQRAYKMMKLP